jgi:hypothetical protein
MSVLAGVAGIRIYIVADVMGLCPAIMGAVRSAEDERDGRKLSARMATPSQTGRSMLLGVAPR